MEVRGTNIFDQENIDWKTWTQALLWHQIVYHKNEFSGYELVINPAEYTTSVKKGDIIGDTRFLSYYIGETRKLSWKELALCLGLWKDAMLPDHHKCEGCPDEEGCKAYFKYDEDQERCSGWIKDHKDELPSIDEEYQKFIERMMTPLREFSVLMSLTSEEMEELMKSLREE